MRSYLSRSVLLVVACLAAPPALEAATLKRVSLRDMITRADLIVDAQVMSITFKNSDVVGPDDADMPHAFVTFAIRRTLKGSSSAGQTVTLRLLGGPDGRGSVTRVSGVPEFRVGDRDMLFIRDNGKAICPLVGWEQGRLRVVRGDVYDAFGREVWITPGGDIARGAVQIDVRSQGYPQTAACVDPVEGDCVAALPPLGSTRPDAGGMLAIVDHLLLEAMASGSMQEPQPVASQDPGALLRVRRFGAVPPPVEHAVPAARPAAPGDDR